MYLIICTSAVLIIPEISELLVTAISNCTSAVTSIICLSLFVCHLFVICLLQIGTSTIPWSALSLVNIGTSTTEGKQAQ